tara:strand:- start:487 stop:1728 length:1242 start_codon:yes stop_codon:yes gene_type:complete
MLYRPFEPSVESKPTIDTKSGGLGTSNKKRADKPEPTWLDKAGSAFDKAQARFGRPAPKPDPIKLYSKPEFTLGKEYEGGARGFTDPDNPYGTTFPSGKGAFQDDDEPKSTTGTMGIGPDGDIVEYGLPEMTVSDATTPYRAVPTQPAIQTGELAPAIEGTTEAEQQELADQEAAAIKRMASEGGGLMSPRLDGKDGDLRESYDELEMDAYLDTFIPEILEVEGLGGDTVLGDLEPTYDYGITVARANKYNMIPEDYDNMEDFARAFATEYRKDMEGLYPDVFTTDLDKNVELGLQSFLWNTGKFYTNQLRELRSNNLEGFIDEMKDTISAADPAAGNEERVMSGLSKRRAIEANIIGRAIRGYVPIATVETAGTRQTPIFIWKDAQGNELNRFEPTTRSLHSDNSLGELAVF